MTNAIINQMVREYGEDFMVNEVVEPVEYCVCCGEEAEMTTDKGTVVCRMCWFDKNVEERTQAWYEAGEVLSNPNKYIVSCKGVTNLTLYAKDMREPLL